MSKSSRIWLMQGQIYILSFFSCVLEVSLEKILALEMEVPHWSAKQSLEDGMLLDWFPGESVVASKADPQSTPMFSTT